MNKVLLLFLSFSLLLISCNKDEGEDSTEQQEVDAGFFALQVGNSWVYNYFRVNSETGELSNLGATETMEVIDEEAIGEEVVFTLKTTTIDTENSCGPCNTSPEYTFKVKDSLGYLVEVDGPILFSSINDEDYLVLSQEFGDIFRVLKPNEVLITVPAGQFVTKDNERYAIDPEGNRFDGQDNVYFAEGIGEIRQTISTVASQRIIYEKQLMSYNVR